MRFNLKNFPKHEELETPLKSLMSFRIRVWAWKHSFEAELRRIANKYRDKNQDWADNIWVVIEEILGE